MVSISSHPCYLTVVAALLVPVAIYPQQASPPAATTHVHQLPIVVDGKQTPELISDDLALTHFLITVAEHVNPTAAELRRQQSRLMRVGLSEQDLQSFLNALSQVKEQLDEIDNVRLASGNSPALRVRWESVTSAARDRVRASLTPTGLARLDAFLNPLLSKTALTLG